MPAKVLMSLPEGVALGAELYYTGTSETIVHSKGVVVGPATSEGYVGKGVALRFPDSEQSVDCLLTEVRPPAPRPPRVRASEW